MEPERTMKPLSKLMLVLIFLSAGSLNCARVMDSPLQGRVQAGVPIPDSAMNLLLARHHVPGVSVVVVQGGRIDWARGYGVLEQGRPDRVDTATLFQAASISKPVSAVAAMRMVARGELSLDEDVNTMLRSWHVPANSFSRGRPITLRMLLSHSAGLSMHGVPEFPEGARLSTLVEILDGRSSVSRDSVRIVVEPGTTYRYSGGGYIILQLLMTDVSGRPFEDLAREFVLKPAGMQCSTFEQPLPSRLHSRAAVGHLRNGEPIQGRWHTLPEQATGGLWTTPSDLASFAIELWQSYHGRSDALLPPEIARQMLTRQVGDFGLGWYLPSAGTFRFQHGGGNAGYRCHLVLSVEYGSGVAIMTNGDAGEDVINELFTAIGRAYGWGV
jgi:CubicO group peptidase (beta-lactamase class C family)